MTPEEARVRAVATIAHHLVDRDRTEGADRPDVEIDAAIILQALTAQGWRPTAARPAPPWMPTPTGPRADPDAVHRHAQTAREALTRQENPTDD